MDHILLKEPASIFVYFGVDLLHHLAAVMCPKWVRFAHVGMAMPKVGIAKIFIRDIVTLEPPY